MRNKIVIILLVMVSINMQAQLLWEISGNGLKNKSYLYGTHHLTSTSFLDSVPKVFDCFDRSKTIVSELVVNNIDASSTIVKSVSLPDGVTLNKILSAEDYAMLDSALMSTFRIGVVSFEKLKPLFTNVMYLTTIYKQRNKIDTDVFIDSYFQQLANEQSKKVVGLETVEQQIAFLFGDIDTKRQAEMLMETIRNTDKEYKNMMELSKIYKSGNLVALDSMMQTNTNLNSSEVQQLLNNTAERNKAWMKTLPNLFNNSPCFVAVGAGHLVGDNGLLSLLKKAGFRVKPIN